MTIPSITPLTTPTPSTADPENFDTRADVLFTELPVMVTEFNTTIGQTNTAVSQVDANRSAAQTAQTAAEAAESASAASANATAYDSAKTGGYSAGDVTYGTDGMAYRAIQDMAQGSVEALSNGAYWVLLTKPTVQDFVDLRADGPGYYFDGVDDYVALGDDDNFSFPSSDFFFIVTIRISDLSGNRIIISKYDGTRREYLFRYEDGILYLLLQTGSDKAMYAASASFSENTTYVLAATYDFSKLGSNAGQLYVNGNPVPTTETKDASFTGLTNTSVGCYIANWTPTDNETYAGDISLVRMGNLALDPTDPTDKAIINGGAVPYKYQGASQTELGATAWLNNYSVSWDSFTSSDYTGFVASNTTEEECRLRLPVSITTGKMYSISFNISTLTNCTLTLYRATATYGEKGTIVSDISSPGTYSAVFTKDNDLITDIMGSIENVTGAPALTITDFSIKQIGCVADYSPSGVGHNTWIDNSGNGNHGTNSGAIPTQLPANHTEFYCNTITADDSFTLPAGYLIDAITLTSTGAIGGGIDVGTTNGGGEIVAAETVSGAVTVNCTLVGGSHYNTTGADDTIYITDADGTGWDSATVDIQVSMKRMEVK